MAALIAKYNTAYTFEIPMIKRAVQDFAVSADWTPATGDVKVSKDGGAAANIGTLPSAIAMGNGAIWQFTLTSTEMTAARVVITVADTATKAVEDQAIIIDTYGNASARYGFDLSSATVALATGGITTSTFASGAIDAAAIASNAIGSAELASGAITSATFAAGAIDASAIATDAIGSAELAAGAATEIAAAVWDKTASSHVTAGTFGQWFQSARTGTAQAGAATTITLDASASATNSYYNGQLVFVTSATGLGQARLITGYVGATKIATVDPAWSTNPDNTSVFMIYPFGEVAAVTGAVGSVTGAVGSVTGAVGSVAAGGIASTSFASGAITAAAIATDAIGAAELAADAVTEIQSGLATSSALTTAQADLDDIQTRIPAALVSGRIDASVGAMAANTVTATAIATDAITAAKIATDAIGAAELAADAVTEIQSGLATSASISALNNVSTAQVKTQITDALAVDTYAEPTSAPAATTTLKNKIGWLYKQARNKQTQTATTTTLFADDTTTADSTSTVSDDGTTFSKGEWT